MQLYACVGLELSDDDADVEEVARDCGHTLSHAQLNDWHLQRALEWHGEPCLEFLLEVDDGADNFHLLTQLTLSISHPAVSAARVLQVQAEPF
ncbi:MULTISPECIES: hypothetical protein [Rheinheimera]|uniref:DUF3303 domain-containing protein n=1 Tax=Rheinheimera marina TaxID=1774958 RepID=A0ABV9JRB6_9GAMM